MILRRARLFDGERMHEGESALVVRAGRVDRVLPDAEAPAPEQDEEVVDAAGRLVTPGWVDPHTHLVFAGDRAGEFARRIEGATYQEIAAEGGGIHATVSAVRAASEEELVELALPRLQRLLAHGVTTCEVKSGYGLTVADELKMLRAVARLNELQPMRLVPTLLALHAVPRETTRASWLRTVREELVPAVARERLAVFCDAWCDEGAFTADECRAVLDRAAADGMTPRLHADQLGDARGARLAADLGAASADHLERMDPLAAEALAGAGTTAVLLPTANLFLREKRHPPLRALRDAGVTLALGTNLNPGSAMSENASLALGLGCLLFGLTPLEALRAFTSGAAQALRLGDGSGTVRPGAPADLVMFRCSEPEHLPYHLAVNHVVRVVKDGRTAFRAE